MYSYRQIAGNGKYCLQTIFPWGMGYIEIIWLSSKIVPLPTESSAKCTLGKVMSTILFLGPKTVLIIIIIYLQSIFFIVLMSDIILDSSSSGANHIQIYTASIYRCINLYDVRSP